MEGESGGRLHRARGGRGAVEHGQPPLLRPRPLGLEVFHLAQGAEDAEALGNELEARFEVDGERARVTAAAFVKQLEEKGMLVSEDGAEQSVKPTRPDGPKPPFSEPELVQHDEPLHNVAISPFDPQLPLAE